jgi:hypothetical protein
VACESTVLHDAGPTVTIFETAAALQLLVSGGIIPDLHWCRIPRVPTEGTNANRSLDKVK